MTVHIVADGAGGTAGIHKNGGVLVWCGRVLTEAPRWARPLEYVHALQGLRELVGEGESACDLCRRMEQAARASDDLALEWP